MWQEDETQALPMLLDPGNDDLLEHVPCDHDSPVSEPRRHFRKVLYTTKADSALAVDKAMLANVDVGR